MTPAAPELTSRQRRDLASTATQLTPAATVTAAPLTETAVEHVRSLLRRTRLLKVRIQAADRTAFREAVDDLAGRAPAAVVAAIGRVVVLYGPVEPGQPD